MVKNDRELIDRRLEDSLDLFQPTARQEQAAEEAAAAGGTRKSRAWDRENPAFAFRISPEDDERITRLAGDLMATRDELARGLLGAALEALEAGRLKLGFERETTVREVPVKTPTGRQTTRRIRTSRSIVTWKWAGEDK